MERGKIMLEKNIRVGTLVKMLDAKTFITLWESEDKCVFNGMVYQLYDRNDFDKHYISYLSFNTLHGVSVMITKEYQY